MTAFWVKGTYYELTLYFDAWNKEIVGYGLSSRKGSIHSYYDGLNQVLERIKKEQTDQLIIFTQIKVQFIHLKAITSF